MQIGTIVKWNKDKKFGFIKPNAGGKDVFIHISNYGKDYKEPYEGLLVNFFISENDRGQKGAYRVSPVSGHKNNGVQIWQQCSAIVLNVILLSALYFLYTLNFIPLGIPLFYAVINFLTFALYVADKSAAQNNTWRVSENTLHLCSILGGWAAAALTQSFLRHKSKKKSFRDIYWMTIVLNCVGFFCVALIAGMK